jgi:hypothetical protein
MTVPILTGFDTIHIDVDKEKCCARVWGVSDLSSLDIMIEFPLKVDLDSLTATSCSDSLILSLSHINKKIWQEMQYWLYYAGRNADWMTWEATWLSMKKQAIEEGSNPKWSHGACITALFALHECAWNYDDEDGEDAVNLMVRFLADCDITSNEAMNMIQTGLARQKSKFCDKDDVPSEWICVDEENNLYVHSSIMVRFDLPNHVQSIVQFDFMPIS